MISVRHRVEGVFGFAENEGSWPVAHYLFVIVECPCMLMDNETSMQRPDPKSECQSRMSDPNALLKVTD